jgi:glycosyltransferase involved in cell wall biosynthesis
MRVGIIARAELGRGLGIQSWEACRHIDPAKTLIVDVGASHEAHPITPGAFPNATVLPLGENWTLDEREVRRWLQHLDVVLAFETTYDWRLLDWARDMHVRTVIQINPEFYRHGFARLPYPDGWWNPSTWRMDALPPGTVHVPVPVALDRFRGRPSTPRAKTKFLHTVGKWAMYDRNGTETVLRAAHLAAGLLDVTVASQDPLPPDVAPAGNWAEVRTGSIGNYWEAYDGFDVLVLPRRYGGLCLPVQEAMAAGLAVVMPAISPNVDCWPVCAVEARMTGRVPLPGGWIPMADVDASHLVNVMLQLEDPRVLDGAKLRSRTWAEEHAWPVMVPLYMERLQAVIDHPLGPPPLLAAQGGHNPFEAHPRA